MKSEHKKDNNPGMEGGREPKRRDVRTATTDDVPDEHAEELTDIDPADFLDPEEFGYRLLQGRVRDLPRP